MRQEEILRDEDILAEDLLEDNSSDALRLFYLKEKELIEERYLAECDDIKHSKTDAADKELAQRNLNEQKAKSLAMLTNRVRRLETRGGQRSR